MLKMRSVISLCLSLALVWSGTEGFSLTWPKWGRCPDLSVEQAFRLEDYTGIWYLQAGYNLGMTQDKGRCALAEYELDTDHNRISVENRQISLSTDKWESISGYAVPVDPEKDEGKFTVSLYLWGFWKVTAPYWVLGTDYDSYSVVYGCENFLLFFHYDSSWLLSRVQNLNRKQSIKFYNKVDSILADAKLDLDGFEKEDQKNCDS